MRPASTRRLRASRVARCFAATAVVATVMTGCSGDSDGEGPDSASSASGSASPSADPAEAALEAGLAAHAEGDLTTAAEQYDKTLEADPTNKFALYNLALIDEASGNYSLAEEKHRAALEAHPAYEPALFNLAILRTSRDPEEAISLYQRAVEAAPKDAAAWLNLGLLLRASGDVKAGDRAVTKAIKLNPKLTDPEETGPFG